MDIKIFFNNGKPPIVRQNVVFIEEDKKWIKGHCIDYVQRSEGKNYSTRSIEWDVAKIHIKL